MRAVLNVSLGIVALAALVACEPVETQVVARNAPKPLTKTEVPPSRAVSCLAEAIYFEARGTGNKGRAAVAHVIVNRAESSKFPDTVCDVVAEGCQFSYRCDGKADVLKNPSARANALRTAEAVLTGAPDITSGALFFHSDDMEPGWFSSRARVGLFGGNIFYR